MSEPVRIFIAVAGQENVNALYSAALGQQRLLVAGALATLETLKPTVAYSNPQILILDLELLSSQLQPEEVAEQISAYGVPVVALLPAGVQPDLFHRLPAVQEVLRKPVAPKEVLERAYQAGLNLRLQQQTGAASSGHERRGAAGAPAGLHAGMVFAVYGKGGTGKTTIATNLGVVLHRLGVRTLVAGFDVPDAVGIQLGLPPTPNMNSWFRAPSAEQLLNAIRHPRERSWPDILLSPNDAQAAANIAYTDFVERLQAASRELAVEQEQLSPAVVGELVATAAHEAAYSAAGRIGKLIHALRMLPRPYTALVLDLPPTLANDWALLPLRQANAVLLVCEPTYTDQLNVAHAVYALTHEGQTFQLPRSALYLVLNRLTPGQGLNGEEMQKGISAALETLLGEAWSPPIIAAIPASPEVRQAQTEFRPAVDRAPALDAALKGVAQYFFGAELGKRAAAPAQPRGGGFKIGPLRFRRGG
ncbi:MAG: AAA family ATPase [Chloroflexota bacterium]|nr:AAA family ATPase [Chloroflexota bacterium]